jgi:hypothetical protein
MPEEAEVVAVTVEKDGQEVFFEVTPARPNRDANAWAPVAAQGDIKIEQAGASLTRVVESVKPIAHAIVTGLCNGPSKPEAVEIQLGVKLSGEVGFFVAKSTGEASINIKMNWKLPQE